LGVLFGRKNSSPKKIQIETIPVGENHCLGGNYSGLSGWTQPVYGQNQGIKVVWGELFRETNPELYKTDSGATFYKQF
jgi:hypothetical protein